jgi:hypothetical protein
MSVKNSKCAITCCDEKATTGGFCRRDYDILYYHTVRHRKGPKQILARRRQLARVSECMSLLQPGVAVLERPAGSQSGRFHGKHHRLVARRA